MLAQKAKSVEMMRLCEVFMAAIVEYVHGTNENGPDAIRSQQSLQRVSPGPPGQSPHRTNKLELLPLLFGTPA